MIVNVQHEPGSNTYVLRYDSSLHVNANCMRFVFYKGLCGYSSPAGSDHKQDYGNAFHRALKVWRSSPKATMEEAVCAALEYYASTEVPESDFRTAGHLTSTVMQYILAYPRGQDALVPSVINGELLLEKNFALPYRRYQHYGMNFEVLLCGTIDVKGTYMGRHAICDYKTTAAWDVQEFLEKAHNSPQLMMYKMVYDKYIMPGSDVGVMLDCVFLSRTGKCTFRRSDLIEPPAEKMRMFERQLALKVEDIVAHLAAHLKDKVEDDGLWIPNFTCCDKLIAKCAYFDICKCGGSAEREMMLGNSFEGRVYDPLKFQKDEV